MKQFTIGDYTLWSNDTEYEESLIRPILVGGEYDNLIDPRPRDVWLDVGAHVGSFTIRYAPRVRSVIAVEAHPTNFALLLRNTSRIDNVVCHNLAITGDPATSEVPIYSSVGENTGTHTVLRPIRGRTATHVIRAVTLRGMIQTLFHGGVNVNAVKLDAEGVEYGALMDLPVEFMRSLDELVFEYHFKLLKDDDWTLYFSLLDHLEEGFSVVNAHREVNGSWTKIVHCTNR